VGALELPRHARARHLEPVVEATSCPRASNHAAADRSPPRRDRRTLPPLPCAPAGRVRLGRTRHGLRPRPLRRGLLVSYEPGAARPSLEQHFDLRDALAALFDRKVDLVMSGAVRNPFIRADIERSKELVYAA
jgi:hypothetical protein